jgi:hypothetical protein
MDDGKRQKKDLTTKYTKGTKVRTQKASREENL